MAARETFAGMSAEQTYTERMSYINTVREDYPEENIEGQIQLYVDDSRALGEDGRPRNQAIVDLAARRRLATRDDLLEVMHLASLDMMVGVGW